MKKFLRDTMLAAVAAGQLFSSVPVYAESPRDQQAVTIRSYAKSHEGDREIFRKLLLIYSNRDKLSQRENETLDAILSDLDLLEVGYSLYIDGFRKNVDRLWNQVKDKINPRSKAKGSSPVQKSDERPVKKETNAPVKRESSKPAEKRTYEKPVSKDKKEVQKYRELISRTLTNKQLEVSVFEVGNDSVHKSKLVVDSTVNLDDSSIIALGHLLESRTFDSEDLHYAVASLKHIPEDVRAFYIANYLPEVSKRFDNYAVFQVIQMTGMVLKILPNTKSRKEYLKTYLDRLNKVASFNARNLIPRVPQTGIPRTQMGYYKQKVSTYFNQGVWLRLSLTTLNNNYFVPGASVGSETEIQSKTSMLSYGVRVIVDPVLVRDDLTSIGTPINLRMMNMSSRVLNIQSTGNVTRANPDRIRDFVKQPGVYLGVFPVNMQLAKDFVTPIELKELLPNNFSKLKKKFKKSLLIGGAAGYSKDAQRSPDGTSRTSSVRTNSRLTVEYSNDQRRVGGSLIANTVDSRAQFNTPDYSSSSELSNRFAVFGGSYNDVNLNSVSVYGSVNSSESVSSTTQSGTVTSSSAGSENSYVMSMGSSVKYSTKGLYIGEYSSDISWSGDSYTGSRKLGLESLLWDNVWSAYYGTTSISYNEGSFVQDQWLLANSSSISGEAYYLLPFTSSNSPRLLVGDVQYFFGGPGYKYGSFDGWLYVNLPVKGSTGVVSPLTYRKGDSVFWNTLYFNPMGNSVVANPRLSSLISVYPSNWGVGVRHPSPLSDEYLTSSEGFEETVGVIGKKVEGALTVGRTEEFDVGGRAVYSDDKHSAGAVGFHDSSSKGGLVQLGGKFDYLDGFVALAYYSDELTSIAQASSSIKSKQLKDLLGNASMVIPFSGKVVYRDVEGTNGENLTAVLLESKNTRYVLITSSRLKDQLNTETVYSGSVYGSRGELSITGGNNLVSMNLILKHDPFYITFIGSMYDRPTNDYYVPARAVFGSLIPDLELDNFMRVYNLWLGGTYESKDGYLGGIVGGWKGDLNLRGLELDLFGRYKSIGGSLVLASDEITLQNSVASIFLQGGISYTKLMDSGISHTFSVLGSYHDRSLESNDVYHKLVYGAVAGYTYRDFVSYDGSKTPFYLGLESGVYSISDVNYSNHLEAYVMIYLALGNPRFTGWVPTSGLLQPSKNW